MNYTPFNTEQILLAHMLVYGEETSKYILPNLLPTRFVYSKEGELGGSKDHATIFKAMTLVSLEDKVMPTVSSVLNKLVAHGTNYKDYLGALRVMLSGYYQIYEFDARYVMQLAEQVDKAGTMFYAASRSHKVSSILENAETFAKAVDSVEDVDEWINRHVTDVTSLLSGDTEGYKPFSLIREQYREELDRIKRGEQLMLLPVGMPSLTRHGLFPTRKLVVIHGMSNSGKSALTHQINIGTAIGLKENGIKGCVAVNSLEEDEFSLHLKVGCMLAGINAFDFTLGRGITDEGYERLNYWLDYASTLPLYIDPTNILTASVMDYRVTGLHASDKGPVYQMSVDYLDRFDTSKEGKDNHEQELDSVIHKCFGISRTTGACVIVISQSYYGNGSNRAKIAGPEGTRGSRSIQHACDIICEIYNGPEMRKAAINFDPPENMNDEQPFLLVQKYRGGPKCDPIPFIWEPEYSRFKDIELNPMNSAQNVLFEHLRAYETA